MSDTPKTGLELQIEAEAKQLNEVPKIPINEFMGNAKRCHICGQLYEAESLKRFDIHVVGSERIACPNCHPQRGL